MIFLRRESLTSYIAPAADKYVCVPNYSGSHISLWTSQVSSFFFYFQGNSIKSPTATANYGEEQAGIFERNIPYIPLGRLGKPEEISAAVCYLLSPAASFVTGTTMIVDGGEFINQGKWPTGCT